MKEQWVTKTGVGIYCSPAVEKDKVFIGDDMGYLTAYALKDGKALWRFQSGKRIVGTPAVSEGIVVFGSADCKIYGLNAQNGNLLWIVKASEPVLGAVTIDNGTAYIGASDHTFRAINTSNGEIKWTFTGVKGYIETKPLVTDSKIIFGQSYRFAYHRLESAPYGIACFYLNGSHGALRVGDEYFSLCGYRPYGCRRKVHAGQSACPFP